jgi:hypothetical protein
MGVRITEAEHPGAMLNRSFDQPRIPQASVTVADMASKDELTPMPFCSRTCPSPELSDKDLERYLLGRMQDQAELRQVENHLIGCQACAERAEAMTASIAALIRALQRLEREDTSNSD